MSAVKAKRSFGAAATLAFFAAVLTMQAPVHAASRRSEIEQREQTMKNAADAANQRTQQERATVDRQREILEYQIRKNRRMQQKMQCQLAGGGTSC